jgi:AcrR family transcriptional regulator
MSEAARTLRAMKLTRARIVGVAMELIEQDGAEALSMRQLATELGCGLVSLYSVVPSKAALLDAVGDAVLSRLGQADPGQADLGQADPRQADPGPAGWQEHVQAQARALRRAALSRPRCAIAIAGRRPARPTAALRPVEQALATLGDAGLTGEDAVRSVRALAAYVLGTVAAQAGTGTGTHPGTDDQPGPRPRLNPAEFPQVTGLAAELRRQDGDADFEFGLDLLVRAIATLLPGQADPAPESGGLSLTS